MARIVEISYSYACARPCEGEQFKQYRSIIWNSPTIPWHIYVDGVVVLHKGCRDEISVDNDKDELHDRPGQCRKTHQPRHIIYMWMGLLYYTRVAGMRFPLITTKMDFTTDLGSVGRLTSYVTSYICGIPYKNFQNGASDRENKI